MIQLKLRLSSTINPDRKLVESIDKVIQGLCFSNFKKLSAKTQNQQKDDIVNPFMKELWQQLVDAAKIESGYRWCCEKKVDESNGRLDKADICIIEKDSKNPVAKKVIIELDKHRADQVAKKFLARMALKVDEELIYVALCYPGSDYMSIPECMKYFAYCATLAESLKNKVFIGYLVVDSDRWTGAVDKAAHGLHGFPVVDGFPDPHVKLFP